MDHKKKEKSLHLPFQTLLFYLSFGFSISYTYLCKTEEKKMFDGLFICLRVSTFISFYRNYFSMGNDYDW